jgi:circadian clock protein KaiC
MNGAAAGERALYVVLSETEREVRRLAASHGWDLAGVDIAQGVPRQTRKDQEYSFYPAAEVELEQVLKGIIGLLEKHRPTRVVFDSLSELRLLAQDRLRYRRQILALKDHFQKHGMTVLLLDFLSHSDDRQLETLCHGILNLEQLAPEYGGQRRRLRIRKLRESDFRDGYHDFTIQQGGSRCTRASSPPLIRASSSARRPARAASPSSISSWAAGSTAGRRRSSWDPPASASRRSPPSTRR